MLDELKTVPLFNENGDDNPEKQELINGSPTGISNLNENRYKWTNHMYRVMTGNFWVPEKVSMAEDKITIKELTHDEDEATKDTLSYLIFLDSFQCLNLPNIHEYITAPNVANLLIIQQYQEVIHSQSYQYILDALYPYMTRQNIYNRWRDNPNLLKRIRYITGIANDFKAKPTLENFKKVIVANLVLEGVYFYNGFIYFDQLASRNKIIQTDKVIDYIRSDEMTHIKIFTNIIREIFTPEDEGLIVDMVGTAVEHEVEWAHNVYGNKILGISEKSSENYVKYLANTQVLSAVGISPLYPEVTVNPYAHLSDVRKKENFFESTVTSYDRSESVRGWDDF